MQQTDILIIGAGASGLAAACELAPWAKQNNKKVILLEKQIIAGRKILVSGNGRCNFTNKLANPTKYYGNKQFITDVLSTFTPTDCLSFFTKLGLLYTEENGRYFPLANKSSAVQQVLLNYIESFDIALNLGEVAQNITKSGTLWQVQTDKNIYLAKKVILACGSSAYPQVSGTNLGYKLAQSLGHTITELKPALTGLDLKEKAISRLMGLKANVIATLEKNPKDQEQGEITFTTRGVSGNNILSLSRQANEGDILQLNFLPQISKQDLLNLLELRAKEFPQLKIKTLFSGICADTLANLLIDYLGLRKNWKLLDLQPIHFAKIVETLTCWKFTISGKRDFKEASAVAGGVNTSEVDSKTLQSKKAKGIFITGELLDIDGRCGGFNLHFAFTCGVLVAKAIKQGV